MKILIIVVIAIVIGVFGISFLGGGKKPKQSSSKKSIYDYSFTTIDGTIKHMSDFKGKKILIVNVASECGFTPQYEDLEKLYVKHKDKLEIIGFPANDFMGQEPGSNAEIQKFCKTRFGVTFWLSQKISVIGSSKSDLYQWLSEKEINGWNDKVPKWNFYKYLISEQGELLNVFPSTTSPMSKDIEGAL